MIAADDPLALADWRRRVQDLHARLRAAPDPRAAWADWHATRSDLFHRHPMSPLPASARRPGGRIPVFDHDPTLRLAVALDPQDGPEEPVAIGEGTLTRRRIARTRGLADRLGGELDVFWIGGYGGGLFVPFADATSGGETYGAGRYVVDAIKGADLGTDAAGRLILDFNMAYHPSCAWNHDYVCPLAPPGNRLPAPVRAGERL